jgi:hypothetical protein
MSIVRALIMITASLLMGQIADAASCKYQENDTDKFTKVVTRWTKWNPLMSEWHFSRIHHIPYVSVHSVDGDAQLLIKFETFIQEKNPPDEIYLQEYLVISEGAPLLIMMADDSILELPALNNVRAGTHTSGDDVDGYKTTGIGIIKYPLDDATKDALLEQSAKTIRITTDYDHYDFEIHEKSVHDFATAVRCSL